MIMEYIDFIKIQTKTLLEEQTTILIPQITEIQNINYQDARESVDKFYSEFHKILIQMPEESQKIIYEELVKYDIARSENISQLLTDEQFNESELAKTSTMMFENFQKELEGLEKAHIFAKIKKKLGAKYESICKINEPEIVLKATKIYNSTQQQIIEDSDIKVIEKNITILQNALKELDALGIPELEEEGNSQEEHLEKLWERFMSLFHQLNKEMEKMSKAETVSESDKEKIEKLKKGSDICREAVTQVNTLLQDPDLNKCTEIIQNALEELDALGIPELEEEGEAVEN